MGDRGLLEEGQVSGGQAKGFRERCHSAFAKAVPWLRQRWGSCGPLPRGRGLPGCGRDQGTLWLLFVHFPVLHPPLEPSLECSRNIGQDEPTSGGCAVVSLQHHWSAPFGMGAGTALDSCTKPVYPSIYMLHRMYICWEHARFSRVSPPVRRAPRNTEPHPGPCRAGSYRDALPVQPPPARASPASLSVSSALSTLR